MCVEYGLDNGDLVVWQPGWGRWLPLLPGWWWWWWRWLLLVLPGPPLLVLILVHVHDGLRWVREWWCLNGWRQPPCPWSCTPVRVTPLVFVRHHVAVIRNCSVAEETLPPILRCIPAVERWTMRLVWVFDLGGSPHAFGPCGVGVGATPCHTNGVVCSGTCGQFDARNGYGFERRRRLEVRTRAMAIAMTMAVTITVTITQMSTSLEFYACGV